MTPNHSRTILLVEDSEDDVLMITRAFVKGGITNPVHVARDGEEALAYLKGDGKYGDRATYPVPSLMLLDLVMPRTDGFEVLRWLRLQADLKALPVVVLTDSSSMHDVTVAYKLGANSFMVKPADFKDVVSMARIFATYWLATTQIPELPSPPSETPPAKL
jgi:CheY-like chemotaxis protein